MLLKLRVVSLSIILVCQHFAAVGDMLCFDDQAPSNERLLPKTNAKAKEEVTLDKLLNRIIFNVNPRGLIIIINNEGNKEALLEGGGHSLDQHAFSATDLIDNNAVQIIAFRDTSLILNNLPLDEGCCSQTQNEAIDNSNSTNGPEDVPVLYPVKRKKRQIDLKIKIPKISLRRNTTDLSALSRVIRLSCRSLVTNSVVDEPIFHIPRIHLNNDVDVTTIHGLGHRVKTILSFPASNGGQVKVVCKLTSQSCADLMTMYCNDLSLVTFHQALHDFMAYEICLKTLLSNKIDIAIPVTKIICLNAKDLKTYISNKDPAYWFINKNHDNECLIFLLAQEYKEHETLNAQMIERYSSEIDALGNIINDFNKEQLDKADSNLKYSKSMDSLILFDAELDQINLPILDEGYNGRPIIFESLDSVVRSAFLKRAFDVADFGCIHTQDAPDILMNAMIKNAKGIINFDDAPCNK
ncbi:MAG: hypothetical protein QS721_10280 [Candidatus Endonucleobacter sp. (ex Gigantidas childressi)]|nr:hypothetical protein [Candidatus Endonucleobacter sp. (ex Gigantidas childressi)]